MAFLDNDGVTRLTGDYLDIFARKEDAVLDPSGGLIRTDDGISIDSLVQESDGEVSGAIAELTAKGHAEQFTTTGKNLLPNNIVSETRNGITFTVNADGSISVKGTSSEFARSSCRINLPLTQGTYTLGKWVTSMINQNVNAAILVSGDTSKTRIATLINNSTITFTVDTSVTYTEFAIYVPASTTVDAIFYPQVEAGSTATEYEPYTGGAPSPSPDYPQDIQVVRGRNLCSGVTVVSGSTQYMVTLFCKVSNLLPSTDYTLSFDGAAGNKLYTNETITVQQTFTVPSTGRTIVSFRTKDSLPDSELTSQGWRFLKNYAGNTVNASFSNVQLELGSVAHDYVPYGYVGLETRGNNLLPTENFRNWSMPNNGITVLFDRDSGSYTFKGTATSNVVNCWLYGDYNANANILTLPAGKYYCKGVNLYDLSTSPAFTFTNGRNGGFFTLDREKAIDGIRAVDAVSGTTHDETWYPYLVRVDDNETEIPPYEPRFHTTTPIPLPSRGWVGSLPDGTADKLHLDGAGKVEWENSTEEVLFDGSSDEGWQVQNNGNRVRIPMVSAKNSASNITISNMLSSHFKRVSANHTWAGVQGISQTSLPLDGELDISDGTGSMTVDGWKTWLSTHNVTVLYPLATPITENCGYVDMPAISGDATVTIPELDALGIKYFVDDSSNALAKQWHERIDTETDEKITANNDIVESNIAMIESSKAKSNHAVGSYFMLDNVLHKATSAIASGETITSGSNATPITLEQVINPTQQISSSPLAVGDTYQISSEAFNHTFVLVQLNRYSRSDQKLLPVQSIKLAIYSDEASGAGLYFMETPNGGWRITISSAGLIKFVANMGNCTSNPYVSVYGVL